MVFSVQSPGIQLAQSSARSGTKATAPTTPPKNQTTAPTSPSAGKSPQATTDKHGVATLEEPKRPPEVGVHPLWMYSTMGLTLALLVLGFTSYLQSRKLQQQLKQEKMKVQELQKQVKVRGDTIVKMEKNPDLINSRDFNLDYLRMRMAEEVFHYEIVNQVKNKVRDKISVALRPKQVSEGALGIASGSGRQIDEIFDVEYKTDQLGTKRTLFRIGIRLVKLPTQPTSVTINQLIDCIETFLSPGQKHDTWQPTIQGRLANLHWDQKAKPTPLLLIEQTQEGTNVTFRVQRTPRQEA
jgi:cell division protein FtsB